MIQLAYLSSTRTLLSAEELADLLVVSRRNNLQRDITGLLLYKGRNVLQVLEGERDDVLRLFQTIEKDERHFGVIRLYEKQIVEREFSRWTMAFQDLNGDGARFLEGYDEFLNPGFDLRGIKPTEATKLMNIFKAAFR